MSVRSFKVSVPFVLASLIPGAAFADDSTATTAQQACVDKCFGDAAASTKKTAVKAAKRAPSATVVSAMPSPSSTSSSPLAVAPAPPATIVLSPTQATIDAIRAEERARAAEEFNADQQTANDAHRADLDRARSEERAANEADANQQLSAERMRSEAALADERANNDDGKIDNALLTPVGVYGFLGGGATNFTQPEATGGTGVGGYWDARLGVGTRSIIGAEVGYTGSARDITALGVGSSAWLMSNGFEGVARLNVPITPGEGSILIEPYTFGGFGWNRYNVVSDASLSADLTNEDNILTVPLGVGMAFGFSGFTLDLRGTYRQAFGSNLFGSETSSFGPSSLNGWSGGGALGFEF